MGTAGMPPPEAVLTELVIMTLLAAVAEAHHTLSMAVGALDRVKDCREERRGGGGEVRQTHTCRRDKGVHTKPHVSHTLVYHQFDCGCAAERVSSTVTRSFCVRVTAGLEVTCDGFNTDAHKRRPYYTQGARPLWAISRLNSMPSQLFQI